MRNLMDNFIFCAVSLCILSLIPSSFSVVSLLLSSRHFIENVFFILLEINTHIEIFISKVTVDSSSKIDQWKCEN